MHDAVPYPDCLLWQLSDYYFQQRGVQSWLQLECPFLITSNLQYAYQLAWVVHAGLKEAQIQGVLPDRLQMLEVAAGSGVFAIFFLKAFKEVCQQERSDYFERLSYLITDYSPRYLEAIDQNPILAPLRTSGQVQLGRLDVTQADHYFDLQGERHDLRPDSFQAVFSNYLFDTLPVAVYQWRNGQLHQKWVRTEIMGPQDPRLRLHNAARPAHHFAVEDTLLISEYRPCEIDPLRPWLQAQLRAIQAQGLEFLIPYSELSHRGLQQLAPLLSPQGLLWIAEMGFTDAPWWRKRLDFWPTLFGLCAAHNVNLTLFERELQEQGLAVFVNRDPRYQLKLLLAQKSAALASGLKESFRYHFVTTNLNETSLRDHSAECLKAVRGELELF